MATWADPVVHLLLLQSSMPKWTACIERLRRMFFQSSTFLRVNHHLQRLPCPTRPGYGHHHDYACTTYPTTCWSANQKRERKRKGIESLRKEYFFCMVINIFLLPASSRRPDQRRLRGCLLSSYILLIDLTNKEPPPASGGQTFPRTPQTCGLAFMDMVYTNSKSMELIKSRKMDLLSARISRSLLLAYTPIPSLSVRPSPHSHWGSHTQSCFLLISLPHKCPVLSLSLSHTPIHIFVHDDKVFCSVLCLLRKKLSWGWTTEAAKMKNFLSQMPRFRPNLFCPFVALQLA